MSISHCFECLRVTVRVDDVVSVEHEGAVVRTGDPQMVTTVAFEEFAELVNKPRNFFDVQEVGAFVPSWLRRSIPRDNENVQNLQRVGEGRRQINQQL